MSEIKDMGACPTDNGLLPTVEPVPVSPPDGASIPSAGWRSMDSAPRDGSIFAVRYHPWQVKSNPAQVQFAQWLLPERGGGGNFCAPWQPDSHVYADAWMPFEELQARAQGIETAAAAETAGLSPEGESPVATPCAQTLSGGNNDHG